MSSLASFAPVAVLYGGTSPEAAVSKNSANAVMDALQHLGLQAQLIELNSKWVEALLALKPHFVFIAGHGAPAEDGTVQAVLESLNLPYNGSGVLASALAMNKDMAKKHFMLAGLDVAESVTLTDAELAKLKETPPLPYPFVMKPVCGGSSLGVSFVYNDTDYKKAINAAKVYEGAVMLEEMVQGRELTATVFQDQAVGVTEIMPLLDGGFYDYDAKYKEGGSKHVYPAEIPQEVYESVLRMAEAAHKALGCSGVTRSDYLWDESTGRIVILEVNTLPGFTNTSLVPEMMAANGVPFPSLVRKLMEDAVWQSAHTA